MQAEGLTNSIAKIGRAALAILISITLIVSLTPLPAYADNSDDTNSALPEKYQEYSILGNIGSDAYLLGARLGQHPAQKYLIFNKAENAEYPLPDNSSSASYAVVSAIDGGSATFGTNDPCVYQKSSDTQIKVYTATGKEIGAISTSRTLKFPRLQQTALSNVYVLIQEPNVLGAYNNELQPYTTNEGQAAAYAALTEAPRIQGQRSYLIPAGFNSSQESIGSYYVNTSLQIFNIAGYELVSHPSTYSGANGTAAAVAYRENGSQVYFVQGSNGNWGIIGEHGNQLTTFSFSDYFLNQNETGKNPTGYVLVNGQWYQSTIEQMIATFTPSAPPAQKAQPTKQAKPAQAKKGSIHKVSALKYKITKLSYKGNDGTVEVLGPAGSRNSIKRICIPSTVKIDGYRYKVTYIASKAFKNCNRLEKVTIKKNTKDIGFAAFYNCKHLRSLVIPSSLEVIHSKAFAKCYRLKYIHIWSKHLTYKHVGKSAFYRINSHAVVHVPRDKVDYYAKIFTHRGMSRSVHIKS